jgi:hypothetical protein
MATRIVEVPFIYDAKYVVRGGTKERHARVRDQVAFTVRVLDEAHFPVALRVKDHMTGDRLSDVGFVVCPAGRQFGVRFRSRADRSPR